MLIKIPLLSFLLFAAIYPLCFWLSAKNPIKNNFHHFHLACPLVVGSLAALIIWFSPLPLQFKYLVIIWIGCFGFITSLVWEKQGVHLGLVSLISLWGLKLFVVLFSFLVSSNIVEIVIALLGGFVVTSTFYAMNLGHFYLNVHGLKVGHLINATRVFVGFLVIRLCWNIYYLKVGTLMYGGEEISLLGFMKTIDGILLMVAIFFGTVFPLIGSYFAFGTLKLKNTQATTGILYVLLSAVLLGDLAYKYYLLKFHLPL